ncbi:MULTISPECIES: DNA polymerase III subunit gamma/tau [Mesotoga]|jgi:DNA polymerase-3 subunit gamma/tau|uniref:DNA polymerase III subunit gamma/tau n=1 Tax=Mesotoga TaxID=1184396 RepID=UPI000EF15D79|nr:MULTISPECIES: DNA polymerase III subunit gamma/tau [Mesotoga]MCP5457894.1 DNA polymerase III subunit gamma/tau [Thermotogota bacterium]RLL81920.1 DNA polymerase III subunits gamma and tau [Mesotoga sp. H07pep.5.4]HOP37418.1 DNA polymerase III subunit gamma/tau [Mesotoga prima]HOZ99303.1 DNA polymerase III subunit gamma/tau [Mesotoga prima]HPE53205.1 DNA polymerase III subunit gamma/tau [Mesotoga prima]
MSEVLYRKYRPRNFNELVGQDQVKEILGKAIEKNKLSHAYIFSGSRGTGKTTSARILAKMLNCLSEGSEKPCGVCDSCKAIDSSSHMDVVELDAASYRGIDEIRKIRDAVSYRPVMGKFKVYIIDEFHMLTREAFNALLKTLEEPPDRVVFILATTNLEKVPETILSRCQIFYFKPLREEDIVTYLERIARAEELQYDEKALRYISKAAHGGMRDAVNLMERVISYSGNVKEEAARTALGILPEEVIEEFLQAFSSGNPSSVLEISEKIQSGGFTHEVFLEQAIDAVKERLVERPSDDCFRLLSALWETNKELKYAEDKQTTFEVMVLLKGGFGKQNGEDTQKSEVSPIAVDENSEKPEKLEVSVTEESEEISLFIEHLRMKDYILWWTLISLAEIRKGNRIEDLIIEPDSEFSSELLKERMESINKIAEDIIGKRFVLSDKAAGQEALESLDRDSREYFESVITGLGLKSDIETGKIKIELEEE